jgi:2-haloacid dehalogenase
LFDVQGTATDFYTTVRNASSQLLGRRYPDQDWSAFVNDWRAAYFERLKSLTATNETWTSVDSVYRSALASIFRAADVVA